MMAAGRKGTIWRAIPFLIFVILGAVRPLFMMNFPRSEEGSSFPYLPGTP